jgi:site-specific recombinase XerD
LFQIENLTKNYLEFCKYQKNLNDKTLKAYKIDLQQFTSFMKETDGDVNYPRLRSTKKRGLLKEHQRTFPDSSAIAYHNKEQ